MSVVLVKCPVPVFKPFENNNNMEKGNKEINLNDVVKYLNRAFAKAAYKASGTIGKSAQRFKNDNGDWETTLLYDYQVDFAYLINTIQRETTYESRKAIQQANDLIHELEAI